LSALFMSRNPTVTAARNATARRHASAQRGRPGYECATFADTNVLSMLMLGKWLSSHGVTVQPPPAHAVCFMSPCTWGGWGKCAWGTNYAGNMPQVSSQQAYANHVAQVGSYISTCAAFRQALGEVRAVAREVPAARLPRMLAAIQSHDGGMRATLCRVGGVFLVARGERRQRERQSCLQPERYSRNVVGSGRNAARQRPPAKPRRRMLAVWWVGRQ